MKLTVLTALFIFTTIMMTGCATEQTIKEALEKHPEYILSVLEKNPEQFAGVVAKSQVAQKQLAEKQQQEAQKKEMEAELKNPKTPDLASDRAILGNKKGEIVVVAYTDFQCPYCQRGHDTIEALRQKYGNRVTYMLKHVPLDFHPMALPAAKRFEAIAMQSTEKAYKFQTIVFSNQSKLSGPQGEKFLNDTAKNVGADITQMKKDMNSAVVMDRINADKAEANKFGIYGTPGFIINGISLKGAYPLPAFEEIISKTTRTENTKETVTN